MVRNCFLFLRHLSFCCGLLYSHEKNLDSIKPRKTPHGQLMHKTRSIKLLLLTSLGFSVSRQTASNYTQKQSIQNANKALSLIPKVFPFAPQLAAFPSCQFTLSRWTQRWTKRELFSAFLGALNR